MSQDSEVAIYLYTWQHSGEYVLGAWFSHRLQEIPRGKLEELAGELMKIVPANYQGEIPVNWSVPENHPLPQLKKDIVPKEQRHLLAEALPNRVSVSLD